ncbi:hypothetical protein BU24DRAFT_417477 [Aaosphaeria arxii CBS 175.79]|uniref:Uncharacterized protein n=1 Tax=Aaosphaeria arxii CBS 175.79 TaxID=1450172 RepID=A0A6A5Y9D7_9PLEO|nr:uncharacterized protein BU24DRAFT_417477 [Aaosphaeria arxii CBS 175.79]KAF2021843.1 hypothetical protein BU24DRAFT_417477 [Aaosphaeria arxii CBS 175.79]
MNDVANRPGYQPPAARHPLHIHPSSHPNIAIPPPQKQNEKHRIKKKKFNNHHYWFPDAPDAPP